MDSKIPSNFWENDALSTTELKCAALWLRTHPGINFAGYAKIGVRRFCSDTGLPPKALDRVYEALGKGLEHHADEVWLRDYISEQFGRGNSLAHSHMSRAIVRAIQATRSPWVALAVLAEYPELQEVYDEHVLKGLGKGMPRACQGEGKDHSIAEHSIAEHSIAEHSIDQGGSGGAAAPAAPTPEPEPAPALEPELTPYGLAARAERVKSSQPAKADRPADLAEVEAFARATLGVAIAPDECAKFFDHFEANGWRQGGRTPLRSWQAAFRNWARRAGDFSKKPAVLGWDGQPFDKTKPNAHTGGAQEAV
jgi:hypothetical protein